MAAKKTSKKSAKKTKATSRKKTTAKKAASKTSKTSASKTSAKKKSTSKKKATAKKASKKASAKKKPAASKKAVSKKTTKKATAKKTTTKKASTKKKAAKKTAAKKKAAKKLPARKIEFIKPATTTSARKKTKSSPYKKFKKKELNFFRDKLIAKRESLSGQVASLHDDSLTREDNVVSEEEGTDAYEREFALNVASAEQDIVFEIDQALRRVESKVFGQCENCDGGIERPRLEALPWARLCISCKSELERDKSSIPRTASLFI